MQDRSAQGRPRDDGRQADIRRAESVDAPLFAECATSRLAGFAEELGRLIENAHRRVELARAGLQIPADDPTALAADAELRAAAASLEGMGRVVHAAMQAGAAALAEPHRSIAEALAHAVEVISGESRDRAVTLETHLAPALDRLHAPGLYTIALHALRWATRTARDGDTVILRADACPADALPRWRLEITHPTRPGADAPSPTDADRLALALAADLTRSAGGAFDVIKTHNARSIRASAPVAPTS